MPEGIFVRVSDSDPEMLRYLAGRGISPGERFSVRERQPFGGPLFVVFGEREHAIGGQLAGAMRVEVDQTARRAPRSSKGKRRSMAASEATASPSSPRHC